MERESDDLIGDTPDAAGPDKKRAATAHPGRKK